MVLEVLDAVLAEPLVGAGDEAGDQVLGRFGHVRDVVRELQLVLRETTSKETCYTWLQGCYCKRRKFHAVHILNNTIRTNCYLREKLVARKCLLWLDARKI